MKYMTINIDYQARNRGATEQSVFKLDNKFQ